ncbi:MAG: hypothetical protein KDJ19_02735 [Hyphomicrobiaceae bacterium]|nr:hypothetical protein [Hyphomicrobiaceae bacterium]MCC0022939.1 hypothetical protein [Hyphomicrobiaceae bacterium]
MFGLLRKAEARETQQVPSLDLSGPRLRRAFENLVKSAETTGGVERYVGALALKASLFEELLGRGKVGELAEKDFLDLAAFITPVRRRIGSWLANHDFAELRRAMVFLLDGWTDTDSADARLSVFVASFPDDKEHRWMRDLGAEILHFVAPDRYPLMTRWMWDQKVATGVLREIWFAENVDMAEIDVPDTFATFVTLRTELEGFLAENGVFRDLPFYIDLLCAHIYAGYINDRGGQYLRSDFTNEGDPMSHTRRMLGLDAVDTESGRTRLKLIDGTAHVLGDVHLIESGEVH